MEISLRPDQRDLKLAHLVPECAMLIKPTDFRRMPAQAILPLDEA
jgi:hypothetical protein